MGKTLNELLRLSELPVLVKADGRYETAAYPPKDIAEHAPETIYVEYSGSFDMPDVSDEQEYDAAEAVERETGWAVLTGWSADPGPMIMRGTNMRAGWRRGSCPAVGEQAGPGDRADGPGFPLRSVTRGVREGFGRIRMTPFRFGAFQCVPSWTNDLESG